MKITVAITGASGTIYARRLIERLVGSAKVQSVAVVITNNGIEVANYELGEMAEDCSVYSWLQGEKITVYRNDDFFTPIASGSSASDAMIVVPCSMGMVGRIANGISDDLISRAADVMLKERLPLIVVPRETPYSLIHLRNLTTLTEAGAIVMPASPSFYGKSQTIADLVDSVVERILKQLNVDKDNCYKWRG